MNEISYLMVALKARLDAAVEPERGRFDIHLACRKQGRRLEYLQTGAIDANLPNADGATRQRQHRLIQQCIDQGLLQRAGGSERNRSVGFSEYGRQYAEHLNEGADSEVLCIFLRDIISAIDETPCHVGFMEKRWVPQWMALGLPEWGRGWREIQATVNCNGYLDLTSMIGRGWLESATDAHGQIFYSATDQGRAALDAMPERYEFDPIDAETTKATGKLYDAEKRAEIDRIKNTTTNEVYVGLPVGLWTREAVNWITPHYWKWRQQHFMPACSECAKAWDKPRTKLTCSDTCRKRRRERLKK